MATWHEIADTLAQQLVNHAYCEAHPESKPDPDCPFCRDRAAYRLWQRKAGVQDPPPYKGPTVGIFDLRRRGTQS